MSVLGPCDEKCTRHEVCDKTSGVCTFHIDRLALQTSLPWTFVERAQDTARSASGSCQSRRCAGTFDPRVSQNVDRRPLDVRKDRCCLGPQTTGLRGRQRRFFRVAQHSDPKISHRAAQRHSAREHVINTLFTAPWHSPQTQTAPTFPKWP